MDCGQAERAIEELLNEGTGLEHFSGLEEHLASCPACRARYERESRLVQALGGLGALSVSEGFTARILDRLPDAAPETTPAVSEWEVAPGPFRVMPEAFPDRLRAAWDSLRAGQAGPARSRRLVPALVGLAAVLLVAALGYGLVTGGMQVTPGAAVGVVPWLAAGTVLLVTVVLVVGLFLLRRHK